MPASKPNTLFVCALLTFASPIEWGSAHAANDIADDQETLGLSQLDTDSSSHALYVAHCGACHDNGVLRAPPTRMLQFMSASAVYKTLVDGVMAPQATKLTDLQKREVAEFVTHDKVGSKSDIPPAPQCEQTAFDLGQPPSGANWGLTPGNGRTVPTATAAIAPREVSRLRVKWAFAFPQAQRARSHPLLAGGAIFTGSQDGTVYALDQEIGCVRWTFQARTEVRTGIAITPWAQDNPRAQPTLFFGDLIGNLYAVNATTGAQIWTAHPEDHPATTVTATPTFHEGIVYAPISSLEVVSATNPSYECCSFRGSVAALDAATGELLWHTYSITPPLVQQRINSAGARNFVAA